jgi:hypothetical protein
MQSMCFTGVLQIGGLANAVAWSVEQLELPALDGTLSWDRGDQPAGRGGVHIGYPAMRANEDADAPADFSGQLQSAGLNLRESGAAGNDDSHRLASQTVYDHAYLIIFRIGVEQIESVQWKSKCLCGRRIETVSRISPYDDGCRRAGSGALGARACGYAAGEESREKRWYNWVFVENFVNGATRQARSGQKSIDGGQAQMNRARVVLDAGWRVISLLAFE